MKKLLSITLTIMMLSSVGVSFADQNVTPVLISAPIQTSADNQQEKVTPVHPIMTAEELRGFIISYADHVLTIKLQESDTTVTVYDKNGEFESILSRLKATDFIEVSAMPVDAEYLLMDIIGYSPRMDGGVTPQIEKNAVSVWHKDAQVDSDVKPQEIDGVMMVPLASTLEAMGYSVTWNAETRSVNISKGAQWTSVAIGENAYAKNRMAHKPLSSAPVIVEGRTLVPVEFFADILGLRMTVESGNIVFADMEQSDTPPALHEGNIQSVVRDETGLVTITLTRIEGSSEPGDLVILHVSSDYTYIQKEISEGDRITAVGSDVMTMSIPPQTAAYVIY